MYLRKIAARAVPRTQLPPLRFQPRAAKADGSSAGYLDGKTVDAMIANPYKSVTSCQMDCNVSTTQAGTTMSVSCSKQVAPGVGQVVLCSHNVDQGRAVNILIVKGECSSHWRSAPKARKPGTRPQRMPKKPQRKGLPTRQCLVPSAANRADQEELEKIGDNSEKLHEFMRNKIDAAMQKALGK